MIDKRTYFFDRHISDVILRLLLVALFIPSALTLWFSISKFDSTFEGLFGTPLLEQIKDTLDRSTVQAGMGQADLFTAIETRRSKEEQGIQSYPRYLTDFGLAPDNPDITQIRLYIFYHKLATWLVIAGLAFVTLILIYLILTTYSKGTSNWKIQRAVFRFFNHDFNLTSPDSGVTQLPLLHQILFDISYKRAMSSDVGEFLYVDKEYYELIYPGQKIHEEKLLELSVTFMDLCSKIYRFQHTSRKKQNIFDYCLLNPLKGKTTLTSVKNDGVTKSYYKAGVFRIVPPLYLYLKEHYSFMACAAPEVFAIERSGHPYCYRLYRTILYYKSVVEQGKEKDLLFDSKIAIPLIRLLEESSIQIPEDGLRDFIADIHDDIAHLVSKKAIESWQALDNSIPLAPDWYESIRSFSFSPDSKEYKRGQEILSTKAYAFDVNLEYSGGNSAAPVRRLPQAT